MSVYDGEWPAPLPTLEEQAIMWEILDRPETGGLQPIGNAVAASLELTFNQPQRDPYYSRMLYREYLETEHWRETRKLALLRAGGRCQRCDRGGVRLDVHHLRYVRLGREAERDLIVLCHSCHAAEHGIAP